MALPAPTIPRSDRPLPSENHDAPGRKRRNVALIPEDKIAEVRDRTDIVQVIGEHVTLRKSGVNHKGLCPFHAEKSPSFNVNSQKQIFHCFGCGKSGDVITFIMETSGQSFIEVVRELAKRAGIALPERDQLSPAQRQNKERNEAERSKVFRLNALAADFYRAELASPRNARAQAYLDKRGITPAVSEVFRLGCAPPGWDGLQKFLEHKKVPHELCERAGLLKAREGVKLPPGAPPTRSTHFDLFRDRVMCPVIDLQGEVVGFSGRILDGDSDAPKYLNTPETPVFKKGEQLFGLHAAKVGMRKAGRAIVVEGNFDVLSMHVHGLTETVAPMGTALTPGQAHLVHRFAPAKVYMFLDGDNAGMKAAARSVGVFLDEDLLSFVALLPRGEDPDTYLRKGGREAVDKLLANARESVEYFCDHVWKSAGASIPERVKLLEEEAAPLLRRVKNEMVRSRYIQQLAMGNNLDATRVERLVRTSPVAEYTSRNFPTAAPVAASERHPNAPPEEETATGSRTPPATLLPTATPTSPSPPPSTSSSTPSTTSSPGEPRPSEFVADLSTMDRQLVALIADHPRLIWRLNATGALKRVMHPQLREALLGLSKREQTVVVDARALADAIHPGLRVQVMQAALSGGYADVPDPERVLRDIVKRGEDQEVLLELKNTLEEARAAGDALKIQELNARIQQLKQQRLGLKS